MEMPRPSEDHRKLELLIGTWEGEETLFPSPWTPQGSKAMGRLRNRLAIDGFAVVQDYEQQHDGRVNFRGHGMFTWNPAQQKHVLYWLDSMGSPLNTFEGSFNEKTLTLTQTQQQGFTRATWQFRSPDRYFYRMEVSGDGKSWSPVMEGTYVRTGE